MTNISKAAPLPSWNERKPASPVVKQQPPNSTPYRVKDGDNWKSIALKYNLNATDLVAFNFRTAVPEEVNWYLREHVGCNVKTPDGRNWRFSSSAAPGIIYIPTANAPIPVPPPATIESSLQTLRRNLLDESSAMKSVPLWAMHKSSFEALTQMALKHIDNLIEMKMQKLPNPVELFGRAFVLGDGELLYRFPTYVSTAKNIFTGGEHPLFYTNTRTGQEIEGPKLPEMSYGKPVNSRHKIYTARLAAILLYESGTVRRLVPYQEGFIFYLDTNLPESWAANNR